MMAVLIKMESNQAAKRDWEDANRR